MNTGTIAGKLIEKLAGEFSKGTEFDLEIEPASKLAGKADARLSIQGLVAEGTPDSAYTLRIRASEAGDQDSVTASDLDELHQWLSDRLTAHDRALGEAPWQARSSTDTPVAQQ